MRNNANKSSTVTGSPKFGDEGSGAGLLEEGVSTIAEIAARWKVSRDFVRRVFERETGVLVLGNYPTRGKRGYRTLRVPKGVLLRVEKRLSIVTRQNSV